MWQLILIILDFEGIQFIAYMLISQQFAWDNMSEYIILKIILS